MTVTYTTQQLETMTKMDLRAVCKEAGIKNASSMTNDGMRQAILDANPKPSTLAKELGLDKQSDVKPVEVKPVAKPNVTVVIDGKKQDGTQKAEREDTSDRYHAKGYHIEKDRDERNGVTRPSVGTMCAQMWDEFDGFKGLNSSHLNGLCEKHGWSGVTIRVQYYTWRKFNGISGRK
jgi:hypothetical protein